MGTPKPEPPVGVAADMEDILPLAGTRRARGALRFAREGEVWTSVNSDLDSGKGVCAGGTKAVSHGCEGGSWSWGRMDHSVTFQKPSVNRQAREALRDRKNSFGSTASFTPIASRTSKSLEGQVQIQ